jgi:hypothetical protein
MDPWFKNMESKDVFTDHFDPEMAVPVASVTNIYNHKKSYIDSLSTQTYNSYYKIKSVQLITFPVMFLGTRFKARNCIVNLCPQEPYRDI